MASINTTWSSRDALRRTALVAFCLLLLGTIVLVFTRVVAARVPEQRATLEKLITDRTGLAVRFENVHFAWGLDGTSAVFTRVELTDPTAGRVRVVAPELRVEFDTWDFLRHQQFSLGHVTVSSPDIEIIEDSESLVAAASATGNRAAPVAPPANDEAALVRRVTHWAQLMPIGRIEVEGARVHLLRRGESFANKGAARRSFTLSQAVISRGANTFNAYGTMLLAQDVGQSLFVSAKLDDVTASARTAGELRIIARRVFLDKLPIVGLRGRGTIDAKIALVDGHVESGTWQASARELALGGDDGPRYDHLTFNGKLSRDRGDVLLDINDLQVTRGARLERTPLVQTRLVLEPRTTRIARTTVRADRMPFMAVELVAGVLAPQLEDSWAASPAGWAATAGELHDLRFDSGERRRTPDAWTFSARMNDAVLARAADGATLAQLSARLHLDAREVAIDFDPATTSALRVGVTPDPRPLQIGGRVTLAHAPGASWLRFDEFTVKSGAVSVAAAGTWDDSRTANPLAITVANLDRTLLADVWTLVNGATAQPAPFVELAEAQVVEGSFALRPVRGADGALHADWTRSQGTLALAALTTQDGDTKLRDGVGTLTFARGAAQLRLTQGRVEDFTLSAARVDWPARGAPRMTATLSGPLDSPLLQRTLASQGLGKLRGQVTLETEARGERELRQPDTWRITAKIGDASIPFAQGVPPIEKLAGTLRYADGQLRALALEGQWLGGPVGIESRRAARGSLSLALSGTAETAALLRLLGDGALTRSIGGQLAWSGSAVRATPDASWQLSLASNLVGVQSDLPEPFSKPKTRALPLSAELRLAADGISDFVVEGRSFSIRGEMPGEALHAHFELPEISGDLRRAQRDVRSELAVDRLDTRRAPALLAVAAAMLPARGELSLNVADLRHADRSLGALRAAVARTDAGLAFSFESADPSLHRISAQGTCDTGDQRCRAEFTADTAHLAALLRGVTLPAELPAERLHASGELAWPLTASDLTTALEGRFDLETGGSDDNHQLVANATLSRGQIQLDNLQGTGPGSDQVFRGAGRVGLVTRDYDVTVDYERMTVAAAAVPTPARARLARAWSALRGSAARRGWTEPPEAKRVQLHGYWD